MRVTTSRPDGPAEVRVDGAGCSGTPGATGATTVASSSWTVARTSGYGGVDGSSATERGAVSSGVRGSTDWEAWVASSTAPTESGAFLTGLRDVSGDRELSRDRRRRVDIRDGIVVDPPPN